MPVGQYLLRLTKLLTFVDVSHVCSAEIRDVLASLSSAPVYQLIRYTCQFHYNFIFSRCKEYVATVIAFMNKTVIQSGKKGLTFLSHERIIDSEFLIVLGIAARLFPMNRGMRHANQPISRSRRS